MAALVEALTHTDAEQQEWRLRCNMAAACRIAAIHDWNEQIGNHNSLMLPPARPEDPPCFLINRRGYLVQELTASSVIVCDLDGQVLQRTGELRKVTFHIHARIHMRRPEAVCVMHVHPQYLTALALLEDPRLALVHHGNLLLNDRVAIDLAGDQPVGDNQEGDRIADLMKGKNILVMGGHGVTVVGLSVHDAFDELFIAERTCMYRITAMSTGQRLRTLPERLRRGCNVDHRLLAYLDEAASGSVKISAGFL